MAGPPSDHILHVVRRGPVRLFNVLSFLRVLHDKPFLVGGHEGKTIKEHAPVGPGGLGPFLSLRVFSTGHHP